MNNGAQALFTRAVRGEAVERFPVWMMCRI